MEGEARVMIKLNQGKTTICDSFVYTDKYGKSVENMMRQCSENKVLTVRKSADRFIATICTPVVKAIPVEVIPKIKSAPKIEKKLPNKIIKSKPRMICNACYKENCGGYCWGVYRFCNWIKSIINKTVSLNRKSSKGTLLYNINRESPSPELFDKLSRSRGCPTFGGQPISK